jgi:monolysocardiolipin acyltransferase
MFPAPSSYRSRSHSWVHIFPEGKVHQHPTRSVRYFKWGVARLILEADPCPTIVPIWIEGLDNVMHESRPKPRFIPRIGRDIKVVFGEEFDAERVFGDLRSRWRDIVRKEEECRGRKLDVGVLTDRLKGSEEVIELRIECARRVREGVLNVRKGMGWLDEEPKNELAEAWKEESDKREGKMKDGSWEKDT